MSKYFKKYTESHWIEVDFLKTISTIAAISKQWPWEVVKLFVNVRIFSRLKKLNVTLTGNSKKYVIET